MVRDNCEAVLDTKEDGEAHCVSHTRTRLLGDKNVNHVLDCAIERESNYTRKKSTVVNAENQFQKALNLNSVQGEIPMFGELWEKEARIFRKDIKDTLQFNLGFEDENSWKDHVNSLVVQGNLLALASAEHSDAIWKSYVFDLKKGTLKFLLNAQLDTLPTGANLVRWNKSSNDKCKLCKFRETTYHILNCCKSSLDQGKYTWRHNNIINYIVENVDTTRFKVYSDIPGYMVGNGTIPPEICITNEKPDIVIIDYKSKTLNIFELTVPFELNIEDRHKQKSNKYAHFIEDITNFTTTVTAFEIGSRGYISSDNKHRLHLLHKFMKGGIPISKFQKNISALSVYSSYHIFLCRKDPTWSEPNYLGTPFQ